METTGKASTLDMAFEQPLFQRERIAADWKRMRSEITSATDLEAAYKAIAPEVAALKLKLTDAEGEELLELYNATVSDGRYIGELTTDPAGVAKKLKVKVSDNAVAAIKKAGSIKALQTSDQVSAAVSPIVAVVVVAVVIVIVFGPKEPKRKVVDSSGIVKF